VGLPSDAIRILWVAGVAEVGVVFALLTVVLILHIVKSIQLRRRARFHAVWRPLVELTRLRHLSFRRRLAAMDSVAANPKVAPACSSPFPASV